MNGTKTIELRERREVAYDGTATLVTARGDLNDDQALIRLGKKPVLKRSFGFMSIVGFSCTVLLTWEGLVVSSATQALLNGGPSGLIYGFLIDWIGTLSTFGTLAELASMAPTAGGQYHWVAMLAPSSSRRFLSYVTAWTTIAGWQALNAGNGFLLGSMIQGLIALTHPNYVNKPWHTMLLFWAIMFAALLVNTGTNRALARFEGIILILHLFGFFAILIPLVYLGPHGDAVSVFKNFMNNGGWSTKTLSFFVGLPASIFCLFGADGAVHMSEEIQHASIAVPQALMYSVIINGTLGFAMTIALMFCIGDIQAALDAQSTIGFPYLEIFFQAVKSTWGACTMASLIVVLGTCATVGTFAASSRMLWSFCRDRGTPFWKTLSKVNSRTSVPMYTVATTMAITILISLLVLGSSVALNDIVSLSIAGLYSSYLLSCGCLLWRRIIGAIKPHNDSAVNVGPGNLHWGPWRLPEPFGTVNNIFACLYLVFLLFWSFWPPVTPVSPQTMNFSVLVFGTVVLFSICWYLIRARKYFQGPVVETSIGEM